MSFTRQQISSFFLHAIPFVTLIISFVVMIGWFTENKQLIQIHPDMAPMVFNTALSFFFLSIGVMVSGVKPHWMRKICGGVAIGIGVLTLSQYITGISVGIDSFFFKPFYGAGVIVPGRMAISTASCLTLLGFSLYFLESKFWSQLIVTTFCTMVLGFACIGLAGYLFLFNSEYGWGSFSRMAFHTACSFSLLSIAMLWLVWRGLLEKGRHPRIFMPFYVLSVGILFTVVMWELLILKDIERSRGMVQMRAESVRTVLDNTFFPVQKALEHMAKRFAWGRYTTFESWEVDAQSYFEDFRGLRRIMWADSDHVIDWVYPATQEGKKNIGLNLALTPSLAKALNQVLRSHKTSMTETFEIAPGERGFVLIVPVLKNDQLKGTLSVVIMVEAFLGPLADFHGYDLAIYEDGVRVLATDPVEPVFARDWLVKTKYTNFNNNWEIRMTPTREIVRENTSLLPGVVLVFGFSVSFLLSLAVRFYGRARESEIHAQEALEWQRASVNSIPLLFISVNSEGFVRGMNHEAERLLEYTKDDVLGREFTPEVWLDPRDLMEKAMQLTEELNRPVGSGFDCLKALAESALRQASEWTLISRTGKRYTTVLSISHIQMATQERSGYLLVFEDITMIKERERLLQEQEAKIKVSSRLASLGEMAAGIAHEINNPLTIINGHVGVLRRQLISQGNESEEIQKKLGAIETTVQRIAKIIRGLRTYARESDEGRFETFTVDSMIEDTLSFCVEKFKNNGVVLNSQIEPNLVIKGRPTQISQVLLNLLNNAYDAVSQTANREIWIDAKSVDGGVEISVTDTGSGVPVHLRRRVMEPFFTTKEVGKGVGLGLSISSGIVQAHNGRFYLDERSLKTRFVMWIPG
ncbi:ATP-binding protein [Bdellovibrio sp. HCB2-146]|uniref:ATP-binding protein n=1 Tax=Bdellovibrio sp. HCB2-146 TaxID=3394362 RepID=UPI0039BD60F0